MARIHFFSRRRALRWDVLMLTMQKQVPFWSGHSYPFTEGKWQLQVLTDKHFTSCCLTQSFGLFPACEVPTTLGTSCATWERAPAFGWRYESLTTRAQWLSQHSNDILEINYSIFVLNLEVVSKCTVIANRIVLNGLCLNSSKHPSSLAILVSLIYVIAFSW